MLRALIWDVDGTLAETEALGHRVAFNRAFEEAGLPWRWGVAEYAELLEVVGGRERILADLPCRADAPAGAAEREALARRLHLRKNAIYAELVSQGGIAARPGVLRLMHECHAMGVALAIATTTSRPNVDALLRSLLGTGWEKRFAAVVCAEDAPAKKPDPLVYRVALQRLGVAPGEAFALEDSPNGLRAALGAGVRCGITRSAYFADGRFDGAAWVRDDLDTPTPLTLTQIQAAVGAT